jgi:uncharacterized iron-regulated membrane protein
MRKSLIMTGTLAAVLAGSAHAQQPSAPQASPPGGPNNGPPGIVIIGPAPQGGPGQPMPPQGNPMVMGGPAAGRAMQEQMMAQGPQGGPPPGGPPHPMMMGHHPHGPEMDEDMMHMHPPKGAVFMFRDGDERMLIKCADEEPTKVCVDAASTLIDKINGGQEQQPQGPQGGQGNQSQ